MDTGSTRSLTLLVTDAVASTELLATVGDEIGRGRLAAVEAAARERVLEHGGSVVKAMGDGLLATFASTRRAVACAIAIQRAVREDPIALRVAVHVGEVSELDGDVLGTAVHVVSRIAGETQPRQILVSDVVRQMLLATPGMVMHEIGPTVLRGLPEPLVLHELVWDENAPAAPRRVTVPDGLVGRDAQLSLLQPLIDGVLAGRGQFAVIAGEAGIGKTALAAEVVRRVERQGARVVWATCWDGEGAPALWPWVQVVRALDALIDSDQRAAFEPEVWAEIRRLLGATAIDSPATPATAGESADAQFRLFDAVARLVVCVARDDPIVIVIDDAHWADVASMELLEFLGGQLRATPVLGIVTYRDVEIGADHVLAQPLARLARVGTSITLRGLDVDGVADLVRNVTGRDPSDEELAELQRRSLGNPFFVRELSQLADGDPSVLPEGVREVVGRRLERLSTRCRALLDLAAVVGQEFGLDVLTRAADATVAEILDDLDLASAARVVTAVDTSTPRWRFVHDLFRETIEAALTVGEAARLHQRVGRALEALRADGRDVAASILAEHFAACAVLGDADAAVRYAREAAMEATRRFAYDESARWLSRAIALAENSAALDRVQLLEVALDEIEALVRAGQGSAARERVAAVHAEAVRIGRPDLVGRSALAAQRLGSATAITDRRLIAMLEEAIDAQPEGDSVLLAELLAAFGIAIYHSGLGRNDTAAAREPGARAVDVARRTGDRRALLRALLAEHDTVWSPDTPEQRLAIAREAMELARETEERELLFDAMLAHVIALGELADAKTRVALEQCCELAEGLRQPRFRYMALTRRAVLAVMAGDLAGGEALADAAARLAEEIAEPDGPLVHLAFIAPVRWLQDRDAALSAAMFEAVRARWGQDWRPVEIVWSAVASGDHDTAARTGAEILAEDADVAPRDYVWLDNAVEASLIATLVGTRADCERYLSTLLPYRERFVFTAGCVAAKGAVAWALGELALALDRLDDAIEFHEEGLEIYTRMSLPAFVALSEAALVTGYARRGAPGDRARADDYEARARRAADEMGIGLVPRLLARRSAEAPGPQPATRPEFRRTGEVWTVRYDGREAQLRDSKGLRDLATLVANPGTDVDVADLFAPGTPVDEGADAVLDTEALRQLNTRLTELDADLERAEDRNDFARAERLRVERDKILDAVGAAVGLGGRSRKLGDPGERARKAVGARIRDAIGRIEAVHPALGEHLRASVSTGSRCRYEPPLDAI